MLVFIGERGATLQPPTPTRAHNTSSQQFKYWQQKLQAQVSGKLCVIKSGSLFCFPISQTTIQPSLL